MMKRIITLALLQVFGVCFSQVGINTTDPNTTLEIVGKNPTTKVEGLLIPKFSGDNICSMPIQLNANAESNMVYATSAASASNQLITKCSKLTGKGFYYWDGTTWVTVDNSTTTINNLLAYVKPMNILLNDADTYIAGNVLLAPTGPALTLFSPNFSGTADTRIVNNPLNVTMWDDTTKLIRVPQQLLGYTITINLSLKFEKLTSNAEASRLAAFTGDAVVNTTNGTYTNGQKIKDLMFTGTKTAVGYEGSGYVRDELVLSPIIVTQNIINNGIKLYIGSAMNGTISFYEPILTIDYGVVNTSTP